MPKYSKKIQELPKKNSRISKTFKNYQKIPKILKISNSLHRTWRPKTLSGLLSAQMTVLGSFLQIFIVLGMYNFA